MSVKDVKEEKFSWLGLFGFLSIVTIAVLITIFVNKNKKKKKNYVKCFSGSSVFYEGYLRSVKVDEYGIQGLENEKEDSLIHLPLQSCLVKGAIDTRGFSTKKEIDD